MTTDGDDNLLQALNVITIMLGRIYDTQMALLRDANYTVYTKIEELHEKGEFAGAPPALSDDPYHMLEEDD